MVIGVGVDVCSVDRFQQMVERRPGVLERLLTAAEQVRPDGAPRSPGSLAGRFAAKEALAKALGSPGGLVWLDAEVVASAEGQPRFELAGTVSELMDRLGATHAHLSLSHDAGIATALVIVEQRSGAGQL